MREHGGLRKRRVSGADFDHVAQTVEGARKDGGHQSVLARQRGDGFEGAAGASQVWLLGIAVEHIELRQCHRGDRILRKRLDAVAQSTELVAAGVVEITAELRVAIPLVQMSGNVASYVEPPTLKPGLVCA